MKLEMEISSGFILKFYEKGYKLRDINQFLYVIWE